MLKDENILNHKPELQYKTKAIIFNTIYARIIINKFINYSNLKEVELKDHIEDITEIDKISSGDDIANSRVQETILISEETDIDEMNERQAKESNEWADNSSNMEDSENSESASASVKGSDIQKQKNDRKKQSQCENFRNNKTVRLPI